MLLISSMITWRSRSISSASKREPVSISVSTSRARAKVLAGHDGEIVGVLAPGGGVQRAAQPLDRLGDFLRAGPLVRALEQHMLDKVADPGDLLRLVTLAHTIIEDDTGRAGVRHRAGQDAQAVVQGGLLVQSSLLVRIAYCVLRAVRFTFHVSRFTFSSWARYS